jgi:MFS family permease
MPGISSPGPDLLNPAAVEEKVMSLEPPGAVRFQVTTTSFLALFGIVGLALYGLPFYYDFMVRDFGWSKTQVTSGNGVSKLLIGPLFGFIAGWAVDKFGPKKLMISGILMSGAALIGLGRMSSLWMFYLFYIFNALGYVCGGPLPNQVLLSQWFEKSRGKAMGLAYLGIGLGGAAVPLISNWLIPRFGWRVALQLLGVLIILIALPMALFVKSPPVRSAKKAGPPPPVWPVLRSPYFYLLAIGSMCSIGAIGGTRDNLKLFLTGDRGFTQGGAAGIASTILVFSLVGRLLMGWLADRLPKKYVMLLIYCLVALSIALLFASPHAIALNLFAVVFGISLGGDYMIIPLMGAELFGVRVLGRLMGIILTADGVAEAVCPMLAGYLRDRTGTYSAGFVALIALGLVGAVAVAFLRQGRAISETDHQQAAAPSMMGKASADTGHV